MASYSLEQEQVILDQIATRLEALKPDPQVQELYGAAQELISCVSRVKQQIKDELRQRQSMNV